jgi:ribonuclease III
MPAPEIALSELQSRLGYRFKDLGLLSVALTHRSASQQHNQRLEFLGDAILGFVIAEYLYHTYTDAPEGILSQVRAALVNRETLASVARELSIGNHMTLGLGEKKAGGRERDSILCDALEAIFGAVYLDGGHVACQQCILGLLAGRIDELSDIGSARDSKTRLQEIMQARGLTLPSYQVVEVSGEEHEQVFSVACSVALLKTPTHGTGRSRRLAEQHAAKEALNRLDSTKSKPRN